VARPEPSSGERHELEAHNAELERLVHVLRSVLDSTVDGILFTDREGNVQLANRPMLMLASELGITGGGTAIDLLLSIEHKIVDRERYRATMERLRVTPDEPSHDEFELAEPYRVFQGFTGPVRGDDGAVVGRVWTLREVTHERELDRLKDEFIATVSHELRTPLTSMMGFLEMLRDGEAGELSGEQRHFLAIVERSAQRLQRLVGDLLFVSRLDTSGIELDVGDVSLEGIVREAVDGVAAVAREREIELRAQLASVPTLRADRARVAQLASNLLSNALKFTGAGGTVLVRTFADSGHAVLEVEDDGVGIPVDEQARLFQRFFRSSTATTQAVQGAGLGLAIAKAIAEAHGGSVALRSQPGEGTCIRVELPLARAQ
jgi:signal transduction histidine kinase